RAAAGRRASAGLELRRPVRDARPARPPGRACDRRGSQAAARRARDPRGAAARDRRPAEAVRVDRGLRAARISLSRPDRSREAAGRVRRGGTVGLSILLVGLGIAVIARTVAAGVGGGLGLLLGGMLVAAGSLRLYLSLK